jgi:signal recognition particle receptor subunit alpha
VVTQVAYQRILQLSYVEDLLTAIKALFINMYSEILTKFVASLHANVSGAFANAQGTATAVNQPTWDFTNAFKGWDKAFDKLLRKFEQEANQERQLRRRQLAPSATADSALSPTQTDTGSGHASGATTPAFDSANPQDAQEIAKNIAHLKTRMKGRGKKGGPSSAGVGSGSDSDVNRKSISRGNANKVKRTWGDVVPTEDEMSALDHSADKPSDYANEKVALDGLVDESSRGAKKDGVYEVKDWNFTSKSGNAEDDDEIDDDFISKALQQTSLNADANSGAKDQQTGYISGLFSRLTGLTTSSRPLTSADLEPFLNSMKEHLMKKNVARDIAERVCDGVGRTLEGRKVAGWRSIKSQVRDAVEESITRILTPKTSTDILLAIRQKRGKTTGQSVGAPSGTGDPYSLTFVGVNGVGKSTNLSKVAFWLLQNDLRVLIAACDTFRSGAVEQLRVHVRNLGMLVQQQDGQPPETKKIELFERGYGKDAAGIAKDAIAYAKEKKFDVVLIDTAGRMQDNEPLMRALAKLVAVNRPDKIVFVGEALVGNEAVDQLVKFDRALRDFSSGKNVDNRRGDADAGGVGGAGRGIDGMLVTKWDTVDDKVGAALSMTFVTGQPILFVGCGQVSLTMNGLLEDLTCCL